MINDVLFISYQSDNHGGKLLTFKAKKSLPLAFSQTVSKEELRSRSGFEILIADLQSLEFICMFWFSCENSELVNEFVKENDSV